MVADTTCSDFGAPKNKVSHCIFVYYLHNIKLGVYLGFTDILMFTVSTASWIVSGQEKKTELYFKRQIA